MNHFLFEFITGGGLAGQEISDGLRQEGELMAQALLSDLRSISDSRIAIARDTRFKLDDHELEQHFIDSPLETILPDLLKCAEIAWLIAPETDNYLAPLAELFENNVDLYTGCSPDAIRLTSSKLNTSRVLKDANINTINTCPLNDFDMDFEQTHVIKPDDGVGGENCFLIEDSNKLEQFLTRSENFIIQPYVEGEILSTSLLVYEKDVRLLACNRQYTNWSNDVVSLEAIGVNECLELHDELLSVAKRLVMALPGLAGYVGVDLIKTEHELFMLEINPRFTTAYAGLSKSLGVNVAELILTTFVDKKLPDIDITSAVPVRIDLY